MTISYAITSDLYREDLTPAPLFTAVREGMLYDYTKPIPVIFKQDFNMTACDVPGDSIRIILDALSLNRQKVAFLNGATSTYFSTPDRAGLDITGDIDIIAYVSADDWTPSANDTIISKFLIAGNQQSYTLNILTSGKLRIAISSDGSTTVTADSSVATGFTNGTGHWIRAKWDDSGDVANFYTSEDAPTTEPSGVSWTQLGSADVSLVSAGIFASTTPVLIGASGVGSLGDSNLFYGKIFRAAIYDGFSDGGGTLVADFDPSQYSGTGSTLPDGVSGNWTRNGQAFIAGDGYHQVAPSDATRRVVARLPRGGFRNFLTATATLPTQNVTTQALEYTLSFKGTGTVTLSGTSTDGPLVGTGADDRVSLTFTPTAGTLTLTVSGSVTEAQLELGDTVTNYQAVGAGRYDITESGVPSVTYTYGAGTQYSSIFGSKNLTWMHDGTGGNAFMGVVVNKADDGAFDYIFSSRNSVNDIGVAGAVDDTTTNSAKPFMYLSNGSGSNILAISGANDDCPRYEPFIASYSYSISNSPDANLSIDGVVVASGDDTGTPSASQATSDMAIMAGPGGTLILPGYECGGFFINGLTDAEKEFANWYYAYLMGIETAAGEVPDLALTEIYSSDFSASGAAGRDGWSGGNSSLSGNQDSILGRNNCLKMTMTLGGAQASKSLSFAYGKRYKCILSVYVPSGQTYVDGFQVLGYQDAFLPRQIVYDGIGLNGSWVDIDVTKYLYGSGIRVTAMEGSQRESGAGAGEVLYIHAVRIYEYNSYDVKPDQYGLLSVERGRDQAEDLSPPLASLCSFELNNDSRTYSPWNTLSPLYENLLPGRDVTVTMTIDATTYGLFKGRIEDFQPHPQISRKSVTVDSLGRMASLFQTRLSTAVYQNIRTDEALEVILDAVGWPTDLRSLSEGKTTLAWWWLDEENARQAITDLLDSEGPPCTIYEDGDGNFVFEDRHYRFIEERCTSEQAAFGDTSAMHEPLSISQGLKDVVNEATMTFRSRSEKTQDDVWEANETLSLDADEVLNIIASSASPFINAITPVATTDYTVSAGSLASIEINRTSGQNVTITLTAGASGATVENLKLRADPVTVDYEKYIADTVESDQSIGDFGIVPWSGNPRSELSSQLTAQFLLDAVVRRNERPRAKISFGYEVGNGGAEADLIYQVSDLVGVNEPETGFNDGVYIENIQHEINGTFHKVIYSCEERRGSGYLILDRDPEGMLDVRRLAF